MAACVGAFAVREVVLYVRCGHIFSQKETRPDPVLAGVRLERPGSAETRQRPQKNAKHMIVVFQIGILTAPVESRETRRIPALSHRISARSPSTAQTPRGGKNRPECRRCAPTTSMRPRPTQLTMDQDLLEKQHEEGGRIVQLGCCCDA
jgi:hypothetical protein